ncbi:hypothetical protein [Polaribacter sp. IC073]|uniref:hypothetical protein n=1 Tax=Polaribacter sp. IC073 TaxID=2508540 RepID=UPI0011BDD94A|nr:hypothetical protein [Polaribacter sp. IC073]TXD47345.1 hypothetical protein ES045_12165 [Polaribacter sp. IC073]
MKTKIFEALKTKYSNLGFNKDVLEGVAAQLGTFVTKEEDIANVVTGAETMLKSFQSFADGRVNTFKQESDKNKTEAEQLKARLAELEKVEEPKPNVEVPEYMKSVLEKMESMQQTITGFQSSRVSQSLTDNFIAQMSDKKVPESYYKVNLIGREFKDQNQLNEFVEAVAAGHETHQQELTNSGFVNTTPPEGGTPNLEKESEALASMISQGTKEIVENNKLETKN